jgi:hypothetical protein
VIRRQLLSPNPSASASVIFLLPHHDGVPPVAADVAGALVVAFDADVAAAVELAATDPELELELDPHAATATTRPAALSAASVPLTFAFIAVSTLSIRLLNDPGARSASGYTWLA